MKSSPMQQGGQCSGVGGHMAKNKPICSVLWEYQLWHQFKPLKVKSSMKAEG